MTNHSKVVLHPIVSTPLLLMQDRGHLPLLPPGAAERDFLMLPSVTVSP